MNEGLERNKSFAFLIINKKVPSLKQNERKNIKIFVNISAILNKRSKCILS